MSCIWTCSKLIVIQDSHDVTLKSDVRMSLKCILLLLTCCNNSKMEVTSVLLSLKLKAMIVLLGELSYNIIVFESDIFMDSHQRNAIQMVFLHCGAQLCFQQTKRAKYKYNTFSCGCCHSNRGKYLQQSGEIGIQRFAA